MRQPPGRHCPPRPNTHGRPQYTAHFSPLKLSHPFVSLRATSSPSTCSRGLLLLGGTPDLTCSPKDMSRGTRIKMEPIGKLRAHRAEDIVVAKGGWGWGVCGLCSVWPCALGLQQYGVCVWIRSIFPTKPFAPLIVPRGKKICQNPSPRQ